MLSPQQRAERFFLKTADRITDYIYCIACDCRWVGTRRIGEIEIKCPECHNLSGVPECISRKRHVDPDDY